MYVLNFARIGQNSLPALGNTMFGLEADLTRLVITGASGSTPIRPFIKGVEIGPKGEYFNLWVKYSGIC